MMGWRPTRPMVRKAAYALALLLVLGVAVPAVWLWQRDDGPVRCAEGVVERGPLEECVGVTDGRTRDAFGDDRRLDRVLAKIGALNEEVAERSTKKGVDYATVAYMTSFTVEKDDTNSRESVRRELQGAYLAQYRANRGDERGSPGIRLLVANTGSRSGQWQHTVDELIRLSKVEQKQDRVLAVAGLGPSTETNKKVLKRLAKHKIAMVASNMTATDLPQVSGFARVSPTNRDEALAAARYLKSESFREERFPGDKDVTALVVKDSDPDNGYAASLAAEFKKVYPGKGHTLLEKDRPSTFDASNPDVWPGEIKTIAKDLCIPKPDVVYFAGRGKHLTNLLDALSNRPCPEKSFTVMAGDDTTNLTVEELKEAAKRDITVLYTGVAHPEMLDDAGKSAVTPSAAYFRDGGWMSKTFPADPRTDGQAMVSHDATLVAIHGVQNLEGNGSPPSGAGVGQMFRHMYNNQTVQGATGRLSFHADGNAENKAVPIMLLGSDGRFQLEETIQEPPK